MIRHPDPLGCFWVQDADAGHDIEWKTLRQVVEQIPKYPNTYLYGVHSTYMYVIGIACARALGVSYVVARLRLILFGSPSLIKANIGDLIDLILF